jgi:hypothetical protein
MANAAGLPASPERDNARQISAPNKTQRSRRVEMTRHAVLPSVRVGVRRFARVRRISMKSAARSLHLRSELRCAMEAGIGADRRTAPILVNF